MLVLLGVYKNNKRVDSLMRLLKSDNLLDLLFLTNADYGYDTTNTEVILVGDLDTGKTFNIDIKTLYKDFDSFSFIETYRYDDYTGVDIFSPLFLVLNKYTDILSSMTINDIDYRHNIRNLCNEMDSLEYKVWENDCF